MPATSGMGGKGFPVGLVLAITPNRLGSGPRCNMPRRDAGAAPKTSTDGLIAPAPTT